MHGQDQAVTQQMHLSTTKMTELTQMASRRISATRIVILASNSLESRALINGRRARAVLILHVRVLDCRA